MKYKFEFDHIVSLFKYTGISFTAGAVTHGFFSEERQFWTAILGISLYIIGTIIEKLANTDDSNTWTKILFIGIFAAIGLGFFTGGLQHFPDSPSRSLWVVPLGFFMSLYAVYLMTDETKVKKKSVLMYALLGGIIVLSSSFIAYEYYHHEYSNAYEKGGHGHGEHGHGH